MCFCSETDPNWDLDIGNDVKDESEKYGQVVHHYVDKNSKVSNISYASDLLYCVQCMPNMASCRPKIHACL